MTGLWFLILYACSGSGDAVDSGASSCETAEIGEGSGVSGLFYVDTDSADLSTYAAAMDENDLPLAGIELALQGSDGSHESTSCEDGSYAFGDLAEGTYVLSPVFPDAECQQRNCPKRTLDAIADGHIKIVTFGDSVPVEGTSPFFPERLAELLSPLADVENKNVARGGSISAQWLPGTTNYENRLRPQVDDADLVIASIGGNDIMSHLDASALADPEGALEEIAALVSEIVDNVVTIADALREENPDVDFLYCLYVDYGSATSTYPWSLADQFLPEGAIASLLENARSQVPKDGNLLMADLFGASQALDDSLDDYLYDSLHFNDRGQTLYAEEIFKTLGGILIGESPLGGEPRSPLGLEKNYSFAP